jgi:hypothetical protein
MNVISNPPVSSWASAQMAAHFQGFKHRFGDESRSLPADDSELVGGRGFRKRKETGYDRLEGTSDLRRSVHLPLLLRASGQNGHLPRPGQDSLPRPPAQTNCRRDLATPGLCPDLSMASNS